MQSEILTSEGFAFNGPFDNAWMWEDMAYDRRLYFSVESYKENLLKRIAKNEHRDNH
jgi:hypothetical protein